MSEHHKQQPAKTNKPEAKPTLKSPGTENPIPSPLLAARRLSPDHILQLQRLIGNQATQRLITTPSTPHVQRKSKQEEAKDTVTAFENETDSPSAFPKLSKAQIISGLRSRIDNPTQINQAGLNACGPASLVYGLASKNPDAYATLTIKLFKYGSAAEGTYVVKPGDDLKAKGPDDYEWKGNKPSQVDWMLLSSMRDTENSVSDFEGGPDEDASAITTPSEMVKWLRKVMGYRTIDDQTNLVFTKGIDHAATVNTKRGEGNYIPLLINANMITTKKDKGPMALVPNHWIVLTSDINVGDDKVTFTAYTWGQNRSVECSKKDFADNYYGAIFAK